MDLSLIVATVDRVDQTRRLLDSLSRQTFPGSFEVIVVDQNPDDRLVGLVATYGHRFPIRHLRQERRLLARARNAGLAWASGDLIGFPDDDCVYEPTTLRWVAEFFRDHPDQAGVIGNVLDLDGEDTVMLIGAPPDPGPVDRALAWEVGMTAAFFIRAAAARQLRFDEALGPGTFWGCGEDVDFMLRSLERGARIYYEPGIVVRHPSPNRTYTTMQLVRRYSSYSRGTGYLMGKHRFPLKTVVGSVLEPLVKLGWFVRQGRWKDLPSLPVASVGRLIGYLGYWTLALARTREDADGNPIDRRAAK
jgi:glycosyltransferase involved in cell wall biosynthesis